MYDTRVDESLAPKGSGGKGSDEHGAPYALDDADRNFRNTVQVCRVRRAEGLENSFLPAEVIHGLGGVLARSVRAEYGHDAEAADVCLQSCHELFERIKHL